MFNEPDPEAEESPKKDTRKAFKPKVQKFTASGKRRSNYELYNM